MSSVLGAVWANTVGLLVEDGSLAIGIVIALAVAAGIAGPVGQPSVAGWTLLGSLGLLLVANVYRAGLAVRRTIAGGPKARP